jgi:hypothetical protein
MIIYNASGTIPPADRLRYNFDVTRDLFREGSDRRDTRPVPPRGENRGFRTPMFSVRPGGLKQRNTDELVPGLPTSHVKFGKCCRESLLLDVISSGPIVHGRRYFRRCYAVAAVDSAHT